MDRASQFALVIDWDAGVMLPSVVGPFASTGEATTWARLNVSNGTWEMKMMSNPYQKAEL